MVNSAFHFSTKVLKTILRVVGTLFLIFVLFVGAIGVYVYKRFNPEQARQIFVEQLTSLFHREVSIEHLFLNPRGIKVVGIRVRRGQLGEDLDLLSCDSALVTIKFRPLLHQRLEFQTVILQAPKISLTRDIEGNWGLSDIFSSTSTSNSGPGFLSIALASAETIVDKGRLQIDDHLRNRKFIFENLSLRVNSFNEYKSFPVEASLTTMAKIGEQNLRANVTAKGAINLAGLEWSSSTAVANHFQIEFEGVNLTGQALFEGLNLPHISADVNVSAVNSEQWKKILGHEFSWNFPSSDWKINANVPASGMIELDEAKVKTSAGNAAFTGLFDFASLQPSLSLEINLKNADLSQINQWSPVLQTHSLKGLADLRMAVTGWFGQYQAREADLTLHQFGGVWSEKKADNFDVEMSATNDFSTIKANVSNGKISAIGHVFDQVSFVLNLDKRNISVDKLSLNWGNSHLRMRAKLEGPSSAPKQVVLVGNVDKLDWNSVARLVTDIRAAISTRKPNQKDDQEDRPWLRTFKYSIPRGFPDSRGHLHVGEVTHPIFSCKDVGLFWTLTGVTPNLDRISGEANLAFGPGQVSDITTAQEANSFLRIVFLPFVFMHKMNNLSVFSGDTAYPKSFDFNRIDGEYGAQKGLATIRYFHLDSSQVVAYAEGTADLAREKVDMNILTRLSSYRGTLPEWWVDEAGRPAIGFRVKGDINKPDLEPRFKKIEENEIERKVEEGRSRSMQRFQELEKMKMF